MNNNDAKEKILLTQWQVCVEMANDISPRRDTMNHIFMTVNLAIMAALSIVWDIKSILLLTSGMVVCILWLLFIRNYKQLNSAKFEIVNKIENDLSFQPFKEEWIILKTNKTYINGTTLEKSLPIMFIVLYIIAIIITITIKLQTGEHK